MQQLAQARADRTDRHRPPCPWPPGHRRARRAGRPAARQPLGGRRPPPSHPRPGRLDRPPPPRRLRRHRRRDPRRPPPQNPHQTEAPDPAQVDGCIRPVAKAHPGAEEPGRRSGPDRGASRDHGTHQRTMARRGPWAGTSPDGSRGGYHAAPGPRAAPGIPACGKPAAAPERPPGIRVLQSGVPDAFVRQFAAISYSVGLARPRARPPRKRQRTIGAVGHLHLKPVPKACEGLVGVTAGRAEPAEFQAAVGDTIMVADEGGPGSAAPAAARLLERPSNAPWAKRRCAAFQRHGRRPADVVANICSA
jgi:hypothetical protein